MQEFRDRAKLLSVAVGGMTYKLTEHTVTFISHLLCALNACQGIFKVSQKK